MRESESLDFELYRLIHNGEAPPIPEHVDDEASEYGDGEAHDQEAQDGQDL